MTNFAIKFPKAGNNKFEKQSAVQKIIGVDLCLTTSDAIVVFKNKTYAIFDGKTNCFTKTVPLFQLRSDRPLSKNVIKALTDWKAEKEAEYATPDSQCDYSEVKGDLIALANAGAFHAISHGVNCFSRMTGGLALAMVKEFGCDKFPLEDASRIGDSTKLGKIDWEVRFPSSKRVIVINSYTQFKPGKNGDYEAIRSCMKEINKIFNGKHIGLPQIGSGIAGLNWDLIKPIIIEELKDCKVTVVVFE